MERKRLVTAGIFFLSIFVVPYLFVSIYFYRNSHAQNSGQSQQGRFNKSFVGKSKCESLYKQIENDFKRANYCKKDSDCKAIMLGGQYVEFGCYKFLNKTIDEKEFYKKMENYYKQCSTAIDDCGGPRKLVCLNKKCVESPRE